MITCLLCDTIRQVLHRLDHSIHTMRLWGNTKAKELCSEWNMNMFFRLIHNDLNGICSERLNEVRAPGMIHTVHMSTRHTYFSILHLKANV